MKTSAITSVKRPFIIILRHQPSSKDGTYAPDETDIEITYKTKVN